MCSLKQYTVLLLMTLVGPMYGCETNYKLGLIVARARNTRQRKLCACLAGTCSGVGQKRKWRRPLKWQPRFHRVKDDAAIVSFYEIVVATSAVSSVVRFHQVFMSQNLMYHGVVLIVECLSCMTKC